jgi:hypothetical protein
MEITGLHTRDKTAKHEGTSNLNVSRRNQVGRDEN